MQLLHRRHPSAAAPAWYSGRMLQKLIFTVFVVLSIGQFCCFIPTASAVVSEDGGAEDSFVVVSSSPPPTPVHSVLDANPTKEFQTEVTRMMDIIISSVYTQKDVFLRELISNSADALEKTRFLSVADESLLIDEPRLEIRVAVDEDARTITITDTGVGMSQEELDHNLGTVARSGTTNFLEAVAQGAADVNLIGQFGVGFYSAFLVADLVTVASRPAHQSKQYIWQSNGSSYVVLEDPRGVTLTRGTEVALHIKEDASEYLESEHLKDLILRYNQFVNFPILIAHTEEIEVNPADEGGADKEEEEEDAADLDAPDGKVKKTVLKYEHVNKQKPLWLRSKEDVSEEEYNEFFRSLGSGGSAHFVSSTEKPLGIAHFKAEGEVDFTALLFIPGSHPFTAAAPDTSSVQRNIRIYARRVLVTDELYEFVPRWLDFVRGIIDSDDLPLKVDRESVSQSRVLRAVGNKVVGKIIDLLRKMSKEDLTAWEKYEKDLEKFEQEEKQTEVDDDDVEAKKDENASRPVAPRTDFAKFLDEFGKEIRYGCIVDEANRNKLLKLLRFRSSFTGPDETRKTTLDQYVERMPEDQKEILFIAGETYSAALRSPHAQKALQKGREVLVLSEAFDEHCFGLAHEFAGREFRSLEKVAPSSHLSEEERVTHKKLQTVFRPLTDAFRTALSGRVSSVVVSSKLHTDAVALSASMWGASALTERMYAAQRPGDKQIEQLSKQRILEINPRHPLLQKALLIAKEDKSDARLTSLANRLLDIALVSAGFHLTEPQDVIDLLLGSLQQSHEVEPDAELSDYKLTEEDEVAIAASDNDPKSGGQPNFGDANNFFGPDGSFDAAAFQQMMAEHNSNDAFGMEGAEFDDDDDDVYGAGNTHKFSGSASSMEEAGDDHHLDDDEVAKLFSSAADDDNNSDGTSDDFADDDDAAVPEAFHDEL